LQASFCSEDSSHSAGGRHPARRLDLRTVLKTKARAGSSPRKSGKPSVSTRSFPPALVKVPNVHMIRFLLLLSLLLCGLAHCQTLPDEEIAALGEVLVAWPALGEGSNPWVASKLSSACIPPIIQGLTCEGFPFANVIGLCVLLL
jgi:hypothetical protein